MKSGGDKYDHRRSRRAALASVVAATIGSVIWLSVGLGGFREEFPVGLLPWVVFPVAICFLGYLGLRMGTAPFRSLITLGTAGIMMFYSIILLASAGILYFPAAVLLIFAALFDFQETKYNT